MVVYERFSAIHASREGMGSVERGNGTALLCSQHPSLHNTLMYNARAKTATDAYPQMLMELTNSITNKEP